MSGGVVDGDDSHPDYRYVKLRALDAIRDNVLCCANNFHKLMIQKGCLRLASVLQIWRIVVSSAGPRVSCSLL